jgi:hypothetical protein
VPQDETTLAHKAVLDGVLLKLSGVSGGDLGGFPAYFVAKKMFACVANGGVGIRLPSAEAANLTFSRGDVVQFQPKGMPSNREWVQINHADSKDYEKDLEVFKASIEFVRKSRS